MTNELVASNYGFNKTARKERLFDLYTRLRLGFLSYESYDAAELRQFCAARRLQTDKAKAKRKLVGLLERADDETSFHRFLDLPPDLRNRVYDLHFRTFEIFDKGPPLPPPITSASGQLRQEVWSFS